MKNNFYMRWVIQTSPRETKLVSFDKLSKIILRQYKNHTPHTYLEGTFLQKIIKKIKN